MSEFEEKNSYLISGKRTWNDILFIVCTTVMFVASTFLFYMQTIRYNDKYKADTSIYVNMSKEKHGVRLITWIYNGLYNVTGNTVLIAIYMGVVITGIILVNCVLVKYLLAHDGRLEGSKPYVQATALIMLFTGSMYLPVIHPRFYKGSWCTFSWHSPTQQLMILFALISLLLFFMMYDERMERVDLRKWIGLMLASIMSVWAKPSFMLVFIPAFVISFVIEVIIHIKDADIGKRLFRLFVIGCSMVPSGIFILWLNRSIFGEGSENKVVTTVGGVGYNVPLAVLCGLLFPITVYIVNIKKLRDMPFQLALGTFVFGVAEWAFFHEEGTRGEHGNFAWGRQFGCYLLFLTAIVLFIENIKDESFLGDNKRKRKLYFLITTAALMLHVGSQLVHFYLMGRGYTYYI